MNREELIRKLQQQADSQWDVIIIGGGATGMGIALDAASRGYKILLLEQSDFGKGTSSRSTKLVHGGVRYMAQGDVLLVMEALHERGRMLKNAPHLTSNQEFIIPLYKWLEVFIYYFGLKFYDILSGRQSLGKSYFLKREEVLSRLPNIRSENLKGGIVYHDGQFDDSRMILALARSCIENNGVVLNYFMVSDLLKNDDGKIQGVKAKDQLSGKEYELKSHLVVNATGVFADNILKIDNPHAHPIIKPSQGVHIVLDSHFLQSTSAIMIPRTDDGRVLFAIPWYGKVVVGTTDTPLDKISMEPVALDEEISFILTTAKKYLLGSPGRKDILSVFAGLRPLASDPDNPESTKEISRRHKIIITWSGLLTVTGGKWTTYRRMAEETIDKAISNGMLKKMQCVTRKLRLNSVPDAYLSDRLKIYGEQAVEIKKIIEDNPVLGEPLSGKFNYIKAEIIWICRNEMPVTLEDMLARRTRAVFLDARACIEMAPEVAHIMAKEFGLDMIWEKEQLQKFSKFITNYIR
jgi:glycerol-3-phosphate dehydrogenase